MTSRKAPPRAVRYYDLEFSPRFEYGAMAQVAETCGAADGNELGAGWIRLAGAPSKLPVEPFLGIGVRARLAWELWKGRDEA